MTGHVRTRVATAGSIVVPDGPTLELVGAVPTGTQTTTMAARDRPDVLVVDVDISDPGVRSVCRRIRAWAPSTRVLAVGPADDEQLYTTLVAGATGAVLCGTDPATLTEAIHATRRGESVLQPRVARRMLNDLDAWAGRAADPINPPPTLTGPERSVLVEYARGTPVEEIAATHEVTAPLVARLAGFAVTKLHRYVLGPAPSGDEPSAA